jgi:hypothetical protein
MPLKLLESYRGSLVYVQRTYPAGNHLTIDFWRPDRDREDGRLPRSQPLVGPYPPAPSHVMAVPRFRDDVQALLQLFSALDPPTCYVRSKRIHSVQYGYADASGGGFGNTLGSKEAITYTHGIWDAEGSAKSSNYRELSNIVTTLEEGLNSGQLRQSEVWLFTDNSVSESVFWRGHSSSPLLSSLILHLRRLEMSGWFHIHLVHIPGTRMIAQGTDGLSRGDTSEGVMSGRSILEFVPLHLSALSRQPVLRGKVLTYLRTG